MITLTQNANTLTISTTYKAEFLREIEIKGASDHIDKVEKYGKFSSPTIDISWDSITLEFATKKIDRFDHGDSVTIWFHKPFEAQSAYAHIQGFPDGSSLKCPVDIIPEPSAAILLGAIGFLILTRRRR